MRRLALAALALPFAFFACGNVGIHSIGKTSGRVIHGVPSDASQDDVVLVVHDDGSGSIDTCSGEILAPNLILTARHCVSTTSDAAMACGADGIGSPEGAVGADFPASSLTVYVGVNYPASTAPPDGTGEKIIHDGATNLCNHDLAMILLAAPIPGAKIAPLRLDDTRTKRDDLVTVVGWGVTDTTFDPTQRMQRSGVKITAVGPDIPEDVAPNELETGESICSGDSGGPALSDSGAVIAITARGGNGKSPSTTVPGVDCTGPATFNDFTRIAPFKSLILDAFTQAGYSPVLESDTPDAGPVDDAGPTDDTGTPPVDDSGITPEGDTGTQNPGQNGNNGNTSSSASCAVADAGADADAGTGAGAGAALMMSLALLSRRRRAR
jgi:hypothetical protein